MVRTQVQLREEQLDALRSQAAREGVSIAELVRRAVDDWVQGKSAASDDELRRRAVQAAGKFASGRDDVAENHDDHLAEAFGG